jgi:hypothetical protein
MEYTPEQRDLIRRIGEVSAQMNSAASENTAALENSGDRLIDAARELSAAMRQTRRTEQLFTEWGDLFREFLDTL